MDPTIFCEGVLVVSIVLKTGPVRPVEPWTGQVSGPVMAEKARSLNRLNRAKTGKQNEPDWFMQLTGFFAFFSLPDMKKKKKKK